MAQVQTGVSYFSSRDLRHVRADFQDIVEHHCNFIVMTYSEEDVRWHRRRMIEIAQVAHDAGLSVHIDPWAVGGVFGGESGSLLLMRNPETHQIDQHGKPLPACCPNHPVFREYLHIWLEAAAETKPDYCFWDEPHFHVTDKSEGPRRWGCFCTVCQTRFSERFGRELPPHEDEDVVTFREECLLELVEEYAAKATGYGMKNNLCLLPFDDGIVGVTRWNKFASNPNIEIIGTDPYWGRQAADCAVKVPPFVRKVAEVAEETGKEAQFWVQNIYIARGDESTVEQALRYAWDAGIRNFAAWSYYGTAPMTFLACGDPKKVWDELGRVYREFREVEKS